MKSSAAGVKESESIAPLQPRRGSFRFLLVLFFLWLAGIWLMWLTTRG